MFGVKFLLLQITEHVKFSIKFLKAFRVFGFPTHETRHFIYAEEHVRKPTETNLQIEKSSMLIGTVPYVYCQIHFSCLSYNLMLKKAAAKN